MQGVIHPERDLEGLQMALRALFEEALIAHRMKSAMTNASSAERARMEQEMPEREISPGYYARAGYLVNLSNVIEMGVPLDPASISQSDLAGIRAVREARATYEHDHPACPACGERQDNRWMRVCYACHYQLRAEKN